ncbi:MAG: helix-turn-helix domain-containing protein [Candidatus Asgardarchaeia archaeon]
MKKQVTEKDIEFLRALVKKPNSKLSEIAKSFGIPPSSAYRIYKKLVDIGVIKGRIYVLDFSYLGYQHVIEFKLILGKEQVSKVLSFLNECEQIALSGVYEDSNEIMFISFFSDSSEIESFKDLLTTQFDIKKITQRPLKFSSITFNQVRPCSKVTDKTFTLLPR